MNKFKNLKSELIDTLSQLFKIYSPTYEEHELAMFLSTQLAGAGWQVEKDSMGNIMARRSEDTSDLPLLNAHMDTLQCEEDQEYLKALTYDTLTDRFQLKDVQIGCDDKAGLGIILCLAKYTDLNFKILLTV
jgi:di/tripeptidase